MSGHLHAESSPDQTVSNVDTAAIPRFFLEVMSDD